MLNAADSYIEWLGTYSPAYGVAIADAVATGVSRTALFAQISASSLRVASAPPEQREAVFVKVLSGYGDSAFNVA